MNRENVAVDVIGLGNAIVDIVAETPDALLEQLDLAKGSDRHFDKGVKGLKRALADRQDAQAQAQAQAQARALGEKMALLLQASLLLRHHPGPLAEAFCAGRLASEGVGTYGTLPPGTDLQAIIDIARVSGA